MTKYPTPPELRAYFYEQCPLARILAGHFNTPTPSVTYGGDLSCARSLKGDVVTSTILMKVRDIAQDMNYSLLCNTGKAPHTVVFNTPGPREPFTLHAGKDFSVYNAKGEKFIEEGVLVAIDPLYVPIRVSEPVFVYDYYHPTHYKINMHGYVFYKRYM